jgi:zinc resistance-associated protein
MHELTMKRIYTAGLAALIAGALSIGMHAWSQTPNEAPRTGAPHARADRPAPPLPSERVEPFLAYVKAALKITPAQEGAWNAVADVIRKHAKARDEDVQKMRARFQAERNGTNPPPRPTAIDRLQMQQQRLTQRAKELDELLTVAKPLYASLNDEQKRVADRLVQRGRGHGGPHMMGRGMRMMDDGRK